MAVVDHLKRFMFVDIKPGSNSDKKMFKESNFGRTIKQRIPVETHFLADAGYRLLDYVLIPFPIRSENSQEQRNYNYQLSRTRMAVEMAFGLWKNKWRVLFTALNLKSPARMAKLIICTMIIHNWLIDIDDEYDDIDELGAPPQDQENEINDFINDDAERWAGLDKQQELMQYLANRDLY
jgi:hypothetical protein